MSPTGVSLKPSDAVAGGGAYDDVDVIITKCRFRMWDYNGTIPSPILGLEVSYKNEADDFEFSQVYSAGDPKHFVPSDDGKFAVPVGTQAGLNDSTNAMHWLASMVNAGFPEAKIGDDVSVFEGTRVHVNQTPQPKRPGVKTDPGTKAKTILTVTKIASLPGEGAKVAGAAKAAPKAAASAAKAAPTAQAAAPAAAGGAPSQEILDKAVSTAMQVVTEKGGSVAKNAIAQAAFKILGDAKDPDKVAVVQLCYKDEFLKGELCAVPWAFDGTTISLG